LAHLRQRSERRTVQTDAIGIKGARTGRIDKRALVIVDESAVVGVGVQVPAIGDIEQVGAEAQLIALGEVDVLADAHIPTEIIGLTPRIVGQEKGLAAADLDRRTVI